MELKYKVGDVFLIPFEVTTSNDTNTPYRLALVDLLDLRAFSGGYWLTENELDEIREFSSPDLKRQRIMKQISDLQKQLEEV